MANGILIYAEIEGGAIRKSAREIAAAGAKLAGDLGGPLSAVVAGASVGGAAGELGKLGIEKVYTAEDAALEHYSADGYSTAVAEAVAQAEPAVVLMAATVTGKDLGPALAGRLGAGLVSDAVGLEVVDGKLRAERPIYAGKAHMTVEPATTPVLVTLRPNVFEAAAEGDGTAEAVALSPDLAGDAIRAVTKEVREPEVRQVDLTEADIIVSGGRGMKGPENFHLVEELAAALGGVVGASRAVVDAGWRPHAEQVGQTGKTVSPRLYVACGISGAIQHLAGMSSSKCIVAINKDPEAPIFKVADYGIVGDVMEVLPALTEKVREKVGT